MTTDTAPAQSIDLPALLAGTSLFEDLDAEAMRKIVHELQYQRVNGGDTVMQQGDTADGLYLVLSGRLRVFVEDSASEERMVGEVGRGESVGEMAVLVGGRRTATVRAVRESELVKLSTDAFERLSHEHPQVLTRLMRTLVRRLDDATHTIHPRRTVATIAVVPAGKGRTPMTDFARLLADALNEIGPTLHLLGASFEDKLGGTLGATRATPPEASAVMRWVNEQEAKYRFVVYEADPATTPWTRRCVRQADYILLVGAAGGDPGSSGVEQWIESQRHSAHAVTDLVLVHPPGTAPRGTSNWLEQRTGKAHHHVRLAEIGDVERVARLITGRGVALVLSGGGARGYAHIGVIKAMIERNIPIDVIGGTSMGAIIAAQFAKGLTPDEMVEQCRKTFRAWNPHRSPTLPLVSLINSVKLNRVLHAIAGDTEIEDMWLRYFSVASNLTRAEVEVQSTGNLYLAIRSSCSVPGLGPPVLRDGELIVDGGVLNNLPADIARHMTQGKVIASNVASHENVRSSLLNADDLSGWAVLFSRLNPLMKSILIPTFPAIIERTATLAGVLASQAVAKQVDLYFQPPVDSYAATQWEPLDTMVDAGYRHALDRIDEWEASGNSAIRHTALMPIFTSQ